MPTLARQIRKQALTDVGSLVILQKQFASSTILAATAQDLSTVATGAFYVEDIIVETNNPGLVGPTNFLVGTNNTVGLTGMTTGLALFETSVASVAVTKTISIVNATDASTSTSPTVSGNSGTLEAGKKLQFAGTGAAGTGAGLVRITVVLRRITAGATISAV